MPRVPIWWEIATACNRCGIVVCPATTLLVDKDIEYRANRSSASVFIGDETSVRKLLKVQSKCPKIKHVLQIGDANCPDGVKSLSQLLQSIPDDARYTGPKPKIKDDGPDGLGAKFGPKAGSPNGHPDPAKPKGWFARKVEQLKE